MLPVYSHSPVIPLFTFTGHVLNSMPVQFTSPLQQTFKHKNQPVTFSCHLTHPDISVTWYKDSVEISDRDKYTFVSFGHLHKLKIFDLDLNDEAVYMIKIDGSEKTSSAMLFLEGR